MTRLPKGRRVIAAAVSAALALSLYAAAFAASGDAADLDGLTTFAFDGDTVTVTEGSDSNYEVVVYDDTDTESAADTATDSNGNTVYSLPDGSGGELLVSIKKAGGSYVFQGEGSGSIAVKKEAAGDAVLYLNGLTLTSSFTSVITVKKDSSAACTIYAVEGTVNTLTDNAYNNDEYYTDNAAAENAVMKFKDGSDVTITGGGTIAINANGKNGIKANNVLTISGDVILRIDAAEDAVNCGGSSLTITGGELTLSAGANAIHADYTLNLGRSGGADSDVTVNIASCEEGLEGATVNIYSGTYSIYSTDDSINAANSDLTDYSYEMNIYGGSIYAASTAGDCLDSNGDITITGGTVVALGALDNTQETNNALDCDGTLTITGGTVLAVGMQEMSAAPSPGSQAYVTWTAAGASTAVAAGNGGSSDMGGGGTPPDMNGGSGGNFTALAAGSSSGFVSNGDVITVSDSQGGELISATAKWDSEAAYSVDYVLFSSPDVEANSAYTLTLSEETSDDSSDSADTSDSTDSSDSSDSSSTSSSSGSSGSSSSSSSSGSLSSTDSTSTSDSTDSSSADSSDEESASAEDFSDVDASLWYYEYIDYVVENGLMNGTGAETFEPEAATTRGMIVTIIYRLAGEPEASGEYSFDDVAADAWYADAVAWAAENGIADGYGDGSFGSEDVITREQLATILYRYAQLKGYDVSIGEETNILSYDDALEAGEYAIPALQWAVGAGLINGTSDSTLSPQGSATRAQSAAILARFIQSLE